MGRKEQRALKQIEKNPVQACNAIQRAVYPDLFKKFDRITDPRDSRYTTYSTRTMLGSLYYKAIGGIESMQQMTRAFNDPDVADNIYSFLGEKKHEFLPHYVTMNDFLSKTDPEEVEGIVQDILSTLIRRKTFNDARIQKHWEVIVDGTELDEGTQKKNDNYLIRRYNKGTDEEIVRYHRNVLEARMYLGSGIVASIATEPIENDPTYEEKSLSDEQIKQDCEQKAFIRLAKKIKKRFPRLPICIVADALYISEPVFKVCETYGWEYIIRYKEGSARTILEEYQMLPERESAGSGIEYANDIVYKERTVNLLVYKEKRRIHNDEEKTTTFMWITSCRIHNKNAEKLVQGGRNRWKIENQGFNRQKHWQGNLEHACSWNAQAQKVHYLMEQIADLMKQLYEVFYLKRLHIEKPQKNISSELLASFGRLQTGEDIKISKTLSKSAFC
jgi:hypothetical protein